MRLITLRWLLMVVCAGVLGAGEPALTYHDDLPLLMLSGDGAARGAIAGAALPAETTGMLGLLRLSPHFRMDPQQRAALTAALDPDHRAELEAWAAAAGAPAADLIAANLALDSQCSVLVLGEPGALRVARNMDFPPATLLGAQTVLTLRRPPGRRAVLSFGWPGYGGVVTGMNDAGVVGAVLQHAGVAGAPRAAEPVTFRIRSVLEHAGDLAAAVARCRAAPVASGHYLLFADAHDSRVLWHDAAGWHERGRVDGRLTCTNALTIGGVQDDDRTAILRAVPVAADDAALRRALAAARLRGLNAQAMIFDPARRTVQLALAGAAGEAADAPWRRLDCARLLAGGDAATLVVEAR